MRSGFDRPFWLLHLVLPATVFAVLIVALVGGEWDPVLAHAWAYDPARGWLGRGAWWAEDLLHRGGRDLVRLIALACLLASVLAPRGSAARGRALYLFLCIAASSGLAGTLKHLTNVDCPWDLVGFGGMRPYVALLAGRPDALPRAACFPGAHAASGFAFVAFYFAFRDHRRRMARVALGSAMAVGIAFSIAQQARGAHFLSHDLTSAALAWGVCLASYVRWRTTATDRGACGRLTPYRHAFTENSLQSRRSMRAHPDECRRMPNGIRAAYTVDAVFRGADGRAAAEQFIRERFFRTHEACVHSFLPVLLALTDGEAALRGVAGYRFAEDETLYLERYLESPVEEVLTARTGLPIARSDLAEIGNFACSDTSVATRLMGLLARHLLDRDRTWVVFTATASIRRILDSAGARLLSLATADAGRMTDVTDQWGRYYEQEPCVMAGYLPSARRLAALWDPADEA